LGRKSEEDDPTHQWKGTYNLKRTQIRKFFKWLYSPNLGQKERPDPECIQNIPELKRKDPNKYSPSDLWTKDEDIVFLRYCPSIRDRCYHMVARDSGCRPGEILKLKIKDISEKNIDGTPYYEIVVNGKTGQRPIILTDSVPYVKEWLDAHPMKMNTNTHFICGGVKALGHRVAVGNLWKIYNSYKTELFPRLLNNTQVPNADKKTIIGLLKKPWNPYLQRHTSCTAIAKILREPLLKQYAGWTPNSNSHLKYLHWFGNEAGESLLEAHGLKRKQGEIDKLKPKECPNCRTLNKIDSKFCISPTCRLPLTPEAVQEAKEERDTVKNQMDGMQKQLQTIISSLSLADQTTKNQMAKSLVDSGLFK
jgi:integrase/recombinase XerD